MKRAILVCTFSFPLVLVASVAAAQHGHNATPKPVKTPTVKTTTVKTTTHGSSHATTTSHGSSSHGGPKTTTKSTMKSSMKPSKTTTTKPSKTTTKAAKTTTKSSGKSTTKSAKLTDSTTTKGSKKTTTTTTTTTTTGETTTPLTKVQQKLQKNTNLASKLESRLPAGTDLMTASKGFKNLGQFVAAVNVSNNLGISFTELKTRMVTDGMSLGQAIQDVKRTSTPETTTIVSRAESDADAMIRSSETSTTTTKTKSKQKAKDRR